MQQHVFPGNEDIVEHEDRVVLVEARRQRIVERRAHHARRHLVGGAAEQFHARRIHRRDEHHREIGVVQRHGGVLAEEIVMRQRRRGRHHLGAGHIDAGIGVFLDGDVDVLDLIDRLGAIDRRIDDGVIHEQHVLLRAPVPGLRVVGELAVEIVIGAERVHQRRLVVRRAAHPAVGHARPVRDGVALRDQFLARARGAEEFVGEAARAGVGRRGQQRLGLLVVQRVVEPRDRARGIAERRMRGDVLDALAIDVDFAAVAQAFEIFRAGERPPFGVDGVLGFDPVHGRLLRSAPPDAADHGPIAASSTSTATLPRRSAPVKTLPSGLEPGGGRMEYFVQQLINGITLGSIYGLIAIGYTMVFGIIGMVNFAHGDVFMVSAFIALITFLILTTWLGISSIALALLIVLIVAMLFTSLVNWAIERVAYRPLRGSFRLAPLISAIGMSIFLSNFVQVTQGPRNKSIPPMVQGEFVLFNQNDFPVTLSYKQLIIWGVTAVLLLAFWYLVAKTPLGRAQRACEQDQKMAALVGVDVDRTISMTFVIAAALAAVAGTMYLMYYGVVSFSDGFVPGVKAFTAAVLGGIGSLPGAVVGGLLIGLIETMWSAYFSIDYKDVAAFSILAITLIFLPQGLFGRPDVEKV